MARKRTKYVDTSKLCRAVDLSRHVMQFYREERMRGVKQLAGHRYSTGAAAKKTYVNFISLYCDIVGRNLYSKNPRLSLSTFDRSSKPTVAAMESWVNDEIEHMKFANTMQRVVIDALFAIGVAKVSLANPSESVSRGWGLKAGSPFVTPIDLDDYVFDHEARDLWEVTYEGHRFSAPLDTIVDSPIYNKAAREKLVARHQSLYNREGDERIGSIGRADQGGNEPFVEMVDLWEIYCPQHGCIYTFCEDDLSGADGGWDDDVTCLREQDWIGPETGPYHKLALKLIPGNPFPKGPVQDIIELADALNESYRKLVRQAADQKGVTVYQMENSEDGRRLKDASDRDLVGLKDPKSVQHVEMNGINQGQALFMKELFERASLMAGNLITMGGLAPQAGTLGQEQLLASQSSGQVASMQDATASFVKSVLGEEGMLWYWWHDPTTTMRTKFDGLGIPGMEMTRSIHPWNHPDPHALKRSGEMPKFKIDPYSMQTVTPSQRAESLINVFTKVYLPMAQLAQQQGVSADLNALFKIFAKLHDLPELQDVLTIAEPPTQEQESGGGGSQAPGMAPETTRNYVRRSLGGQSSQAQGAKSNSMLETGGGSNGKALQGQLQQI